ncbi:MAG: hypothetical protein IJ593_11765 [Lachnospiraceae bacterium]|nr:hypothetical protein [Lachnospiraceae bacterium]
MLSNSMTRGTKRYLNKVISVITVIIIIWSFYLCKYTDDNINNITNAFIQSMIILAIVGYKDNMMYSLLTLMAASMVEVIIYNQSGTLSLMFSLTALLMLSIRIIFKIKSGEIKQPENPINRLLQIPDIEIEPIRIDKTYLLCIVAVMTMLVTDRMKELLNSGTVAKDLQSVFMLVSTIYFPMFTSTLIAFNLYEALYMKFIESWTFCYISIYNYVINGYNIESAFRATEYAMIGILCAIVVYNNSRNKVVDRIKDMQY